MLTSVCILAVIGGNGFAAEAAVDRLQRDLVAQPRFRSLLPTGRTVWKVEHLGEVRTLDFAYQNVPSSVPPVLKSIGETVARNCDSSATLLALGEVSGTRSESVSLTTTRAWEIGGSVSFKLGFPLVGETTWTFTASYSESSASTEGSSRSSRVSQSYRSAVLPLTEHILRLVVYERQLGGIPYRLDLELSGRARLHHAQSRTWIPRGQSADGGFAAGSEPVGDGTRVLRLCRAFHVNTTHPGKVVGARCNITYADEEIRKSHYDVMINDTDAFGWTDETYTSSSIEAVSGETKASWVSAGREPYRYCKPGTLEYQDCIKKNPNSGELYVCAAKHSVLQTHQDSQGWRQIRVVNGWHPGKIVRRDCMIGYGGIEKLKGSYRVLERTANPNAYIEVDLADYLSLEQRTFRIEGLFSGVAASNAELTRMPSRPANQLICGARAGAAVSARSDVAIDVDVVAGAPVVSGRIEGGRLVDQHYHVRQLALETPMAFGDDVVLVQQALVDLGWPVRVDGFYGPGTAAVIEAFQGAHGLPEDGVVGGATLFWLDLSDDFAPPDSR